MKTVLEQEKRETKTTEKYHIVMEWKHFPSQFLHIKFRSAEILWREYTRVHEYECDWVSSCVKIDVCIFKQQNSQQQQPNATVN